MHRIISALKESNLFTLIEVIELIDEESVKLLKVKAKIIDKTLLHITELHTIDFQKYSYHWQDKNGKIILRWDNKPHWKKIKTFPHHKHEGDKVLPSHRIDIDDVIKIIMERNKLLIL